jgi:SAM-dependent methyltransferase
MNWEDRKKIYDSDYYDGELEGHYREWWWTDVSVWMPRALIIKEAFLPQTVLDCGCAKGSLVKFLRYYGIESYGFDLSEYAIAATPFPDIKDSIFVMDLAITEIMFPDLFFDVICCFDFLEHQDNEHIKFVADRIAKVAGKYILIRQPFYNIPIDQIVQLNKESRGASLIERFTELKSKNIHALGSDEGNVEHPNTRSREEVIGLFSGFKEVFLDPIFYDILMGSDPEKCMPVLPFYETVILRRQERRK